MSDCIVPDWGAPRNVKALFTTRNGGTGHSRYASFNLGDHVGDDPMTVEQNRAVLRRHLPNEPCWLKQVHQTTAFDMDAHDCSTPPAADAVFSRQPGNVCAVLVADCLPVLLCDRAGTMVAAIHAGWRGMAGGVIERTVAAMSPAATQLMAWLGPAIGPNHFEVGNEVRRAFITNDERAAAAFVSHDERSAKWFGDLFLLARLRLLKAGVNEVYGEDLCTFSDPSRFFSYRRDGVTGRMAGLIWLAD